MRAINPAKSFAKALADSKQAAEQLPPQQEQQIKKLLEVARLYRQCEEAWFDKIKRKEFAVNEKDRMMDKRRQLDYLISTIHL